MTKYKYLGVMLDTNNSPAYHINFIENKVGAYFIRNQMLHKKYYTPYSLIRIIDYFVKSRLSYGLCCFLDNPSTMKRLEDVLAKHLKSIFGLPINTSNRRMLATIGEAEIKMRLAVRLLKNLYKCKLNFGTYQMLYEKTLLKYFDKGNLFPSKEGEVSYSMFKNTLIDNNIRDSNKEFLSCEIRKKHREFLKKYIFCWPDLRNWNVIRYFTNSTHGTCPSLFPICGCGDTKAPDYGANHCTQILQDREDI